MIELKGKDANRFARRMLKKEKEPITQKEKELAKEIMSIGEREIPQVKVHYAKAETIIKLMELSKEAGIKKGILEAINIINEHEKEIKEHMKEVHFREGGSDFHSGSLATIELLRKRSIIRANDNVLKELKNG